MQFEVVLCLEGLLADLTLEPPADAVSGEVAPEIPFARENLTAGEITDETPRRRGLKIPKVHRFCALTSMCAVPFDSVGRGSCVRRSVDAAPVPPGSNICFDTSHT